MPPAPDMLPGNVATLHSREEELRQQSVALLGGDPHLLLDLQVIERAMNLLDALRQAPVQKDDHDQRAVVALGLRSFNSFAGVLRLGLAGYAQAAVLVLRDAMETAFLVELFSFDRTAIERWRTAERRQHRKEFRPDAVRKALSRHHGQTSSRRDEHYALYSELAGHATMAGFEMLRPEGRDMRSGPFVDLRSLGVLLDEATLIATSTGLSFGHFMPTGWADGMAFRREFVALAMRWKSEIWDTRATLA